MHLVKIFGERNTSTNAVKALIENNSKSAVVPSTLKELSLKKYYLNNVARKLLGQSYYEKAVDDFFKQENSLHAWKHTATYFNNVNDFSDVFVLITVRNPASFLLSLYKNPYHIPKPKKARFCDFLAFSWCPANREGVGINHISPIDLYNKKISSYIEFANRLEVANKSLAFVKFEDFAISQEKVFDSISGYLDKPSDMKTFRVVRSSTKDKTKNESFYRNYYGNEKWLDEIDDNSREIINEGIKWDQIARFGYQKI